METVNNIASAASRAIWGEGQDPNNSTTTATTTTSGQEPVAGELGDVKHGEPYDKGNMENSSVPRTMPDPMVPTTGTSNTTAGPHDSNVANKADPRVDSDLDGSNKLGSTGSNPALTNTTSSATPSSSDPLHSKTPNTNISEIPGNTPATQPIRPEHETDKTGVTSAHQPSSAMSSTKPSSSNDTSDVGPTPSVSAAPTSDFSASHPSNMEQGSTNPKDTPSSTQKDVIKDTKRDIEESANEPSKAKKPQAKGNYTEEGGTPGGMPDTIKESLAAQSHEEGTGEKYVKSSGMTAEGGDFDAANPGAGREADRLLAEKGIHHEPAIKKTTEDSHTSKGSSGSGEKEKVSFSEKIKDKLHIHKH